MVDIPHHVPDYVLGYPGSQTCKTNAFSLASSPKLSCDMSIDGTSFSEIPLCKSVPIRCSTVAIPSLLLPTVTSPPSPTASECGAQPFQPPMRLLRVTHVLPVHWQQ